MSISPFHGGLVFNKGPIDSSYPTQIPSPSTITTTKKEIVKKNADDESGLNQRDINEFYNPNLSKLTLQERYDLCLSVGEENNTPEELMALLKRKQLFNCYDGFEPSGRMHIA